MKSVLFAAAMLAAIVAVPDANAQVLVSEDFSYADGDLATNGGWNQYGSATPPLQVVSGQAVIEQDGNPTQDVKIDFASAAGTIYYGLDFTVDDLGTPFSGTDFEYFAVFYNGTGGDNLSARVDLQAPTGAGDFAVGIASDEGTADATWGTDLNFGTTYRAVVSYNQATNQAQFWLDPAVPSDLSILGEDRPDPGDVVSGFGLRQATSDSGGTVRVDNLLVGRTFEDVVTFSSVPEPGSITLMAIGLLGVASRRRRA